MSGNFPFGRGRDGFQGLAGLMGSGRGHAHELAVLDRHDVFHGFGGFQVDGNEFRTIRRRTQYFAVIHAGQGDVGRILVRTGYNVAGIRTRD